MRCVRSDSSRGVRSRASAEDRRDSFGTGLTARPNSGLRPQRTLAPSRNAPLTQLRSSARARTENGQRGRTAPHSWGRGPPTLTCVGSRTLTVPQERWRLTPPVRKDTAEASVPGGGVRSLAGRRPVQTSLPAGRDARGRPSTEPYAQRESAKRIAHSASRTIDQSASPVRGCPTPVRARRLPCCARPDSSAAP